MIKSLIITYTCKKVTRSNQVRSVTLNFTLLREKTVKVRIFSKIFETFAQLFKQKFSGFLPMDVRTVGVRSINREN